MQKKSQKRHDKATEKTKTAPYAVMAQEYKPEGEVIEDWNQR